MKTSCTILLLLVSAAISAQQKKFDIITYTPPKGWKVEELNNVIAFSTVDKTKGAWCQVALYSSTASKGSIENDFTSEWNELVKKQYNATGPQADSIIVTGDWKVKAGGGTFTHNKANALAMLTTMTGHNVCVSILSTTNNTDYLKDIQQFLETINLQKPTASLSNNQQVNNNQPVNAGTYAFSSTNFNDGWTSVIKNDWVEVTKGDIKVQLFYREKFNESEYSGTGKEKGITYWNNYVGKYFTTGEAIIRQRTTFSDYSRDYVEGWATDKQTGEKKFVAMMLNIFAYTGTLSVVVVSAPDDRQLKQAFPKADMEFNNDLLPMYGYNKFAVGANDLKGTWSTNGGGTTSWYSSTTGQYVGATGAATADVFKFNGDGTYNSEHKGGYGVVGSMTTYQQKYKGAYTVTNWSISATNRWDGKTENFDAWFEAVKGGRVLHLNTPGIKHSLVKEN